MRHSDLLAELPPLCVLVLYRQGASPLWLSSSSASWPITSGCWWRACTCRPCWPWRSSPRGNTSGGTFWLAGVSRADWIGGMRTGSRWWAYNHEEAGCRICLTQKTLLGTNPKKTIPLDLLCIPHDNTVMWHSIKQSSVRLETGEIFRPVVRLVYVCLFSLHNILTSGFSPKKL